VTDEDGAATGDTWSIEPGTVTINTLTINGKQVTVDVFRQLKEAVLINHDGSLAGSPWGLVNYHQKRCDKLEKHAHVVWQLGDQLRQDTIQAPRWEPFRSATCGALVFARGTMERLPGSTMWSGVPPEDPVRPRQSRPSWFSRKSHQDLVQAPPDEPEEPARFRWNTPEFGRWAHGAGEWIFRLNDINGIECRAKLRDTFVGGPELAAEHSAADRAALLAQLKDEVAAETEAEPSMKRDGPRSKTCPQLFIAV
jgi:hypothetical protein